MAEKLAQFRATHDNPHGSDYAFQPDENGDNIGDAANGIVKGLGRERTLAALDAKRLNASNAELLKDEAHDTNMFILGRERFDTRITTTPQPEQKKKKGKGKRHKI